MDLWLAPHDARIRSLRDGTGGPLGFGHATTSLGGCAVLFRDDHLMAMRFVETREEALEILRKEWPAALLSPSDELDRGIPSLIERVGESAGERAGSVPVLAFGTPFQLTVWEYLRRTDPVGTLTYGELARAIGRPSAARAVGRAVGANGIAVAIPCHRVVSVNGLTGYRWGVERKRRLLEWELSRRDPLKMPF